jgi:hypothetical protein
MPRNKHRDSAEPARGFADVDRPIGAGALFHGRFRPGGAGSGSAPGAQRSVATGSAQLHPGFARPRSWRDAPALVASAAAVALFSAMVWMNGRGAQAAPRRDG